MSTTTTSETAPTGQPQVAAYKQQDAPDEVVAFSRESEYKEYRRLTDLREPYHIPTEYLLGTKKFVGLQHAEAPLIVFINAKSGGRVGARLASVLFTALGQGQVFDLADSRPGPVLTTLWENLLAREATGDERAAFIRRNLRILAAGGDGTVTWILQTILDLKLDPRPAVGVMPLGTGNDLSLSFGWGNMFLNSWIHSRHLYNTLKRFADAEVQAIDAWRITVTGANMSLFQELPHSLRLQPSAVGEPCKLSGSFWNYYSIGLDAEAAYDFHVLRERRPWAAATRGMNQAWYSFYSCTSGWFCGAPPLGNKLRLRVKDAKGEGGGWREVAVPRSVRALVLLNLQSYGGGRDIWGLSSNNGNEKQGFSEPIFDDGLVEVVGLGSGWHTALVMGQITPQLHAMRLAQCTAVEVELAAGAGGGVKGEQGETHMQLDGEPWKQIIPAAGEEPLRVQVSCLDQSNMLLNNQDVQGTVRARWLAKRGAEKRTVSMVQLASTPQTRQNGEGAVANGGSPAER